MLVYPEHQQRAQDELDTVVGRARVPTFADRPNLPYVNAIVQEVLRWRPVLPMSMCAILFCTLKGMLLIDCVHSPHASLEDDFYEGFFIPKGTVVLPNLWEINRDINVYGPDAHVFNPGRHLDRGGQLLRGLSSTKDENHYTFGSFNRSSAPLRPLLNTSARFRSAVSACDFAHTCATNIVH